MCIAGKYNEEPLVSVIIVTYNNASVIEPCILSLRKQSYKNFQVIVVDNCSKDSTLDILANYSEITIVRSEVNSGFTGGNILGLSHAKGDFIALLNPDTEPCKEWLQELMNGMITDDYIGICSSKLIVYGSDIVDSAGDGISTTGRGYKRGEGRKSHEFTDNEYIFGSCGGAMLIRRKLLDHIGFLDDHFFLIHEDTDFNFRAQLAGWKCLFVGNAIVGHKVRSSIGVMSDIAVFYSVRNSRFVWIKNMPLGLILKYVHHHIIQEIGSFLYFCLKYGKWKAYLKANVDFFRLLPVMLKKRKAIQCLVNIDQGSIDSKLMSLFSYSMVHEKIKKFLK